MKDFGTPHCSNCGRENPVVDDGYTSCCNKSVCYCAEDDPYCFGKEKREDTD